MSRLPRHLEHLRTGFNAEAMSAASFRAYAEHAEAAGKPNLALRWRGLADEKDRLASALLHAAGKTEAETASLRDALAEEQYENEVLYPRLIEELEHLGRPRRWRCCAGSWAPSSATSPSSTTCAASSPPRLATCVPRWPRPWPAKAALLP